MKRSTLGALFTAFALGAGAAQATELIDLSARISVLEIVDSSGEGEQEGVEHVARQQHLAGAVPAHL